MSADSRSVVVTGAGAGIGRAVAKRLACDGWLVVGLEVDQPSSDELASALGDRGLAVTGDVRDRAALQAAADQAVSLAPLQGWVNNAGVTRPSALPNHDPTLLREVMEINFEGAFWGCETAVRTFLGQGGGGAIVNVSSIHGRRSFPDHAAYDASKGAIDALTRNVAVAHGASEIRANAVAPGAVHTPLMERQLAGAPDRAREMAELVACTALRRLARPAEIASVVAFLLSDDASYVSGQSLGVDGAWSAGGGPA